MTYFNVTIAVHQFQTFSSCKVKNDRAEGCDTQSLEASTI